ncbi:MAG: hypothetical protein V1806_17740 [Pseudomonadota bacterium]
MSDDRRYLVCPQRPGTPRVALEVCRICPKAKRCAAWRDFRCPSLFPGLQAQRPQPAVRVQGRPAAPAPAADQSTLPLAGV